MVACVGEIVDSKAMPLHNIMHLFNIAKHIVYYQGAVYQLLLLLNVVFLYGVCVVIVLRNM